jgi:hypothetical protein
MILEDYKCEIEKYCERNMLSVNKIYNTGACWNNEDGHVLITGDWYPDRGYLGLLDDLPAPVLLEIYLENGKLRFVQTEHTYALFADNAKTPPPIPQKPWSAYDLAPLVHQAAFA